MAKIVDMPKLSPTMEEGVLQIWHKKEGDPVDVDDLLAEVETDKATMEFRAFDKGTLLKILVPAGTNVRLGQPVAIVGNAGEDVSGLAASAGAKGGAPSSSSSSSPSPSPSAQASAPAPQAAPSPPPQQAGAASARRAPKPRGSLLDRTEHDEAEVAAATGANGHVLASPYVRKVARERGLDLTAAQGSGAHGRILPEDLESLGARGNGLTVRDGGAVTGRASAPALRAPEVRPLSPMRKTIARRLTQAKQTVPHFYLTVDVNAASLVALRERINAELSEGAKGDADAKPLKLSINDLLVKASATALTRVPECNAQFTDDAIWIHQRVDISVAVAIPDGLVTPVLRDADKKDVVSIAREIRDLAARARSKKLKPEEMADGTFSISNLGMFGIDAFAAVINPPEGAILAVGQVRDEPAIEDGAVVAGKRLSMTLSCDHRVVDGAVGAAFLAELRALIERPMRILTG